LRTINANPNFLKWPGNTVYYYIDPAYRKSMLFFQVTKMETLFNSISAEQDKALIKMAMQKVTSDLNSCIKFQETTPEDPLYKIKITPNSDLP
jgi:hypothetical protein